MHLSHKILLLKVLMGVTILPLIIFGILIYRDPLIYIVSLYTGNTLGFSLPLQLYTAGALILEPTWVTALFFLIRQRNEVLEVHRNQIRSTLEEWIKFPGFGQIEIVFDGFSAFETKEPSIKFYDEAKEHLISGYNKEPYNAWSLWEEIIRKWAEEKARVKTLWFAFECIVTNGVNSLDLTMVNWDRLGHSPIYWYDLSKFLYGIYREIEEFDGKRKYNNFPKINRQNRFLIIRREVLAKGPTQELHILKRTFVKLFNNPQLIKLVKLMKPNAYIKATEKFEKCMNKIIMELELRKPLLGKCSTLGY